MQHEMSLCLSSQAEIAVVRGYGTVEEMLCIFNPDAKNKAILHEAQMLTPGRTPKLRDVAAAHSADVAQMFLQSHILYALDILGVQTVANRALVIKNLAAVLFAKYQFLMLSEWLIFFSHLENYSELPSIYSQPKFVRFLDQWIRTRNNQVSAILRAQEQDKNRIDLSKTLTFEEYLSKLTPSERGKSTLVCV